MLPTIETAHQFLTDNKWSNLQYDAFGYVLGALNSKQLPNKLWLVVPREEDILVLMESLQFWISKHRNILYYPANDIDSLDGISPARSVQQRRLLRLLPPMVCLGKLVFRRLRPQGH